MTFITRHPRYDVHPGIDFNWNRKSWTHNVFRSYEVIFGRREGIRAESSVYYNSTTKKTVVAFHSFESVIAYTESYIRGMVPKKFPYKIWVPVMQTPQGFPMFASPFLFAIALDTSAYGGTASGSLTYSFTATGSNIFLHTGYLGHTASDTVIGVAWNTSETFTQLATSIKIANTRYTGSWGRANATSGTHNIVISASNSVWGATASYSGVSSSTPPDSSNSGGSTTTALTVSTTVVASNCWLIGVGGGAVSGPLTGGTGTTQRVQIDGQSTLFDSNGTVGTGSQSLQITGTSQGMDLIVSSIAPVSSSQNKDLTTTSSVSAVFVRSVAKTFNSTVATSGVVTRGLTKTLSSLTAVTASMTKQMSKILIGNITATGVMVALRAYLVTMTGTIVVTAEISKVRGVIMNATATISGVITKTVSLSKTLTGTVGTTGVLLKQMAQNLAGTISMQSIVAKTVEKIVSASITVTGSVDKLNARVLTATTQVTSTLLAGRAVVMNATLTVTASIQQLNARVLIATTEIIAKVSAPFWKVKYPSHGDGDDYEVKYPHE